MVSNSFVDENFIFLNIASWAENDLESYSISCYTVTHFIEGLKEQKKTAQL